MFGDWLLAITAYNCGAGAMKRALKKAEKKDLWYLIEHNMLSKQASEYVPKLLAIADVATNHKYYKITLPTANDIYGNTLKLPVDDFEFVTVKQEINLSWLAHELRIDYETLKNLNLALIKGTTPPNQKYSIRVPYGMKKTVEYVLNQHY
jgi:membrane-bound lytic murein transglycosylase D